MNTFATGQLSGGGRAFPRFYKWELLFWLCLAFFFHQGDRAIFGVVISEIRADLGTDRLATGPGRLDLVPDAGADDAVGGHSGRPAEEELDHHLQPDLLEFGDAADRLRTRPAGADPAAERGHGGRRGILRAGRLSSDGEIPSAHPRRGHVAAPRCAVRGGHDQRFSRRLDRPAMGLALGVLCLWRLRHPAGNRFHLPAEGLARSAAADAGQASGRPGPTAGARRDLPHPDGADAGHRTDRHCLCEQRLHRVGAGVSARETGPAAGAEPAAIRCFGTTCPR